MSKLPLHIGDTKGIVLVIHLNQEGMDWLLNELPQDDRFTREIHEAARHIDRITSESDADALSYDGIGDGIEEPWCWGENSYEHYQNQCQHNYAGSVTHDREAESEGRPTP